MNRAHLKIYENVCRLIIIFKIHLLESSKLTASLVNKRKQEKVQTAETIRTKMQNIAANYYHYFYKRICYIKRQFHCSLPVNKYICMSLLCKLT